MGSGQLRNVQSLQVQNSLWSNFCSFHPSIISLQKSLEDMKEETPVTPPLNLITATTVINFLLLFFLLHLLF